MAYLVKSGNVTVEVSEEMTRKIRAAIDRAAPWLAPAVEGEVEDVVYEARQVWPAWTTSKGTARPPSKRSAELQRSTGWGSMGVPQAFCKSQSWRSRRAYA